ncbi:hypothetical protein B0A48_16369 [Cryoendolithus antarcticus]|uniref:Apple domain-containing protein n=1 Tax=Cryoendolithus antarcticus TaxID=1507870 RepID=A0A1V8SDT4_9PEZI|nr:hypothetical protein B0A48_16369 [Cryoendolithus antarcticus]
MVLSAIAMMRARSLLLAALAAGANSQVTAPNTTIATMPGPFMNTTTVITDVPSTPNTTTYVVTPPITTGPIVTGTGDSTTSTEPGPFINTTTVVTEVTYTPNTTTIIVAPSMSTGVIYTTGTGDSYTTTEPGPFGNTSSTFSNPTAPITTGPYSTGTGEIFTSTDPGPYSNSTTTAPLTTGPIVTGTGEASTSTQPGPFSSSTTTSATPVPSGPCAGTEGSRYTDANGATYDVRSGYDSSVNSYNGTNVGSIAECYKSCDQQTPQCTGFTYVTSGTISGVCYLKSGYGTFVQSQNTALMCSAFLAPPLSNMTNTTTTHAASAPGSTVPYPDTTSAPFQNATTTYSAPIYAIGTAVSTSGVFICPDYIDQCGKFYGPGCYTSYPGVPAPSFTTPFCSLNTAPVTSAGTITPIASSSGSPLDSNTTVPMTTTEASAGTITSIASTSESIVIYPNTTSTMPVEISSSITLTGSVSSYSTGSIPSYSTSDIVPYPNTTSFTTPVISTATVTVTYSEVRNGSTSYSMSWSVSTITVIDRTTDYTTITRNGTTVITPCTTSKLVVITTTPVPVSSSSSSSANVTYPANLTSTTRTGSLNTTTTSAPVTVITSSAPVTVMTVTVPTTVLHAMDNVSDDCALDDNPEWIQLVAHLVVLCAGFHYLGQLRHDADYDPAYNTDRHFGRHDHSDRAQVKLDLERVFVRLGFVGAIQPVKREPVDCKPVVCKPILVAGLQQRIAIVAVLDLQLQDFQVLGPGCQLYVELPCKGPPTASPSTTASAAANIKEVGTQSLMGMVVVAWLMVLL